VTTFVRCSRCLIPTTRPSTEFRDGLCSACICYDRRKQIDWVERERQFIELIRSAPKNNSGYHCIVASSGGKDSHAQVLKILELGFKPLIVTAQTCSLTPVGHMNIENLRRFAPTIVYEYDMAVRRKLNILGQDLVGDLSWPEHVAIFSAPFRVAKDLGISVVLYGENQNAEYGGPLDVAGEHRMTRRWIAEHGGHLGLRPSDMVGMDSITEGDMEPYTLPDDEAMEEIQALFMGAFFAWNSQANAEVALKNGMQAQLPTRANWWFFENQDCFLTGIHDFLGFLKYGYGRLCAQISVDLRYGGLISREDAYRKVKERDGLFPLNYMGKGILEILDDLGVSPGWFLDSCNRFMNKELFVEDHLEWGQDLTLREFAESRMAAE
jgi:N-acetyl sugar amidotransferase